MRSNLTYFSRHHARMQQNENKVPFKELMPLVLRNYVVGATKKTLEGKCLIEMTLLMGCWKENQFNSNFCTRQLQDLNTCYNKYQKSKAEEKKQRKSALPSAATKIYTSKQINHMLL